MLLSNNTPGVSDGRFVPANSYPGRAPLGAAVLPSVATDDTYRIYGTPETAFLVVIRLPPRRRSLAQASWRSGICLA